MQKLGGWWRVWIVATLIMAGALFASQFKPSQRDIIEVKTYATAQATADRLMEVRRDVRPRCVPSSYFEIPARNPTGTYLLAYACRSWTSLLGMIGNSLIPGVLLLLVGLIIQWVRKGFGPRQTGRS